MKKFIILVSLIMAAAVLFGCAAGKEDAKSGKTVAGPTKYPLNGPVEPIQLQDPPTPSPEQLDSMAQVRYWNVLRNGGSVDSGVSYRIFSDAEELSKELLGRDLPEGYDAESFEKVFVIAVYMSAPTGGWTYELKDVRLGKGRIDVEITAARPQGEATQAFETQIMLIAVDREAYKEDMIIGVNVEGLPTPGKQK